MNMRLTFIISTLVTCGLSLSCESFIKSIKETNRGIDRKTDSVVFSSSVEDLKEKKSIFLEDMSALIEVEKAFRNRPELKNKSIKIYGSIHFYNDYRISLAIQNPDNPTYVDEYSYRDQAWSDPKPVILSKYEKIAERTIDLDKIPFKYANNVYNILKRKSQEIGSKSTDYTVYVVINKQKIRWYPGSITSDRSRYSIEFNDDGTLKSFEQD
ncbi:hypothetical protein [Sphingobacterium sp. LRF_L2]|uniref:hypothetical protein n=1 Tax=Sphingobacterium sp. LRF_L2 TaxID=3369421 RepID=UPI003F61846D